MHGWYLKIYRNPRVKNPAASCRVFDSRGSRQMDMQACPLGSLPAEIKAAYPAAEFTENLHAPQARNFQKEKSWGAFGIPE